MTALVASRRRRSIHEIVRIAVLSAAVVAAPARAADTVKVMLDQSSLTHMPERAVTLVLGNPLIADVSIQAGGLLVITGKGFGTTNLIALDRDGAVLAERYIEVVGPQDKIVVVYRGVDRQSYSCRPDCQPRLTLGDTKDFFSDTGSAIVTRSTRARAEAGDVDALWQLQPRSTGNNNQGGGSNGPPR